MVVGTLELALTSWDDDVNGVLGSAESCFSSEFFDVFSASRCGSISVFLSINLGFTFSEDLLVLELSMGT